MKFFKYPVTDIPDIFLPYGQKEPFAHCINCHCDLLQDDVEYIVEKVVRRYQRLNTSDVIFEYAICLQCAETMRKELSTESLQNVQLFMEKSNLINSRQKLIQESNWNIHDWLSRCAVSGEDIEKQDEYQIYGHCRGRQLIFSAMPYMISGRVMEEISELLSPKTKGELDRFMDDNFGIPPELRKNIQDKPIVMI